MRCCSSLAALFVLISTCAQAGILAQFRTVYGDIEVELFEKDKPITVNNFIRYIQSGRYRNGFIQRCDPTFVIQGGGFYVSQRGTLNAFIDYTDKLDPIPNEYGVGNVYSNGYGTIAMGLRGGDTNSANSEWFFNLANNFELDNHALGNYFTVFGKVIRGTNVLNVFRTFTPSTNSLTQTNTIYDFGLPLNELPLRFGNIPAENTLIYVDITLLNVEVRQTANVREISWNSVLGKTNRVEFTAGFPPIWNPLVVTNGTGTNMIVRDSSAAAGRRFYRVTVDY